MKVSHKIWIIMTVMLVAALIGVVVWLSVWLYGERMRADNARMQMEYVYENALHDSLDSVSEMENSLAKLLVSGSRAENMSIAADVYKDAAAAAGRAGGLGRRTLLALLLGGLRNRLRLALRRLLNRRLLLGGLFLGGLLLGSFGVRLLLCHHLAHRLLTLGRNLLSGELFGLGRFLRLRGRLGALLAAAFPLRKVGVKIFHLVLFGVVVQHQAQLLLIERGHAFALPVEVLGQQIQDILTGHPQIPGHLMHTVFCDHKIKSSSLRGIAGAFANHRQCREVGTRNLCFSSGHVRPSCKSFRTISANPRSQMARMPYIRPVTWESRSIPKGSRRSGTPPA